MSWPILLAAAAALLALHFWWRARFRQARDRAAREIAALQETRQETAAREQARQTVLFDSMIEGLLLLDEAGRIQLANRAFLKLFAVSGDLAGKTLLEVLRWHELTELIAGLDARERSRSRELRYPATGELWLQISAAAIFDTEQKRLGTILVFHNVTSLKKLERMRVEFVANVSHELRTPLSHIKGYVESLLDGAQNDPAVVAEFLQTIDRNARRLDLLIQDLLTISALESGRVQLSLNPVDLRPLVEETLGGFKDHAARRNMRLVNTLPDLRASADTPRLHQVLANLVDNAVRYGREGGTITVGARPRQDGKVEVFVQDDGPGIPTESLDRVFERFYRVDRARSREQGGTGLGLAIVKHIVQSHGGTVWVESELGRGATFHFTLPTAA